MPGARTCSLAARRGLPRAVATEPVAESPQGPEWRVAGGRGAQVSGVRSGGRSGVAGAEPAAARGRGDPWPPSAGPCSPRGSGARPHGRGLPGNTLPARGLRREVQRGAGDGGPGRADSRGSAIPLESATFPETLQISRVETNDPFTAAGILAAARHVPGSPEQSLPFRNVTKYTLVTLPWLYPACNELLSGTG